MPTWRQRRRRLRPQKRPPARIYPGPFSEVVAPLGLTGLGGVPHSFTYQGCVDWIRGLSLFYDPSVGLSGQILDRTSTHGVRERMNVSGARFRREEWRRSRLQGMRCPTLCRRLGRRRPACGGIASPGQSTPTASCRELHSNGPPQLVATGSPWCTRTPPVHPALPRRPVALLPVNPVPGSPIARCVPHRLGRILAVSSRA